MRGLADVHPATPAALSQGWLALLCELEHELCEVTGMHAATLQPAAGAAGELTGLLLMRAYHDAHGEHRTKVVIPDSAHGTNPASVTLGGYEVVTVPSDDRGLVDVEALRGVLDRDVAGIMLTNPNTLGLFEEEIEAIAEAVHEVGGLLYYDGANLNAIVGVVRPGTWASTSSTSTAQDLRHPARGGGPGAGPVAVAERLADFLPGPRPTRTDDGGVGWTTPARSIGRIHSWHGNALVLARAHAYLRLHGRDGLRRVAERAVLNANWLRVRLTTHLPPAFDRPCMHEVVLTATPLKRATSVRALDVGSGSWRRASTRRPSTSRSSWTEALMIEPTETESPQTLLALAEASSGSPRRPPRTPSARTRRRPRRRSPPRRGAGGAARGWRPEDDREPSH